MVVHERGLRSWQSTSSWGLCVMHAWSGCFYTSFYPRETNACSFRLTSSMMMVGPVALPRALLLPQRAVRAPSSVDV